MKRLYAILALLYCMFSAVQAHSAELDDGGRKIPSLFQSNAPLSLRIDAPFRKINRHRGMNRPYSAATMDLAGIDGKETQVDLRIKVRGNFRSDWENCKYPPLKLNLNSKSLKNTVLNRENKLKLVVQCRDQNRYKQYLILEYLSYRVFQLLTRYSLNVRLARIDYYDTEKKHDLGRRVAFFIENTGRFASRLDLEELKVKAINPGDYSQARLNLVEMFEFLIGNTDWSTISGEKNKKYCCHNIIPFKDRSGSLIPIAYDFDMTGVVNPSYAVVNPKLGINSVRQRLYRGHCQNDEILQSTINAFMARRKEIYSLYKNQPGLSAGTIKKTIQYYDDFYDIIQKKERLKRDILNKCR